MNSFNLIKNLHSSQLYSNICDLMNLEPKLELTSQEEYQISIYHGDALFGNKEYKKAEKAYLKALDMRKSLLKAKKKSQQTPTDQSLMEVNVKYQLYLCHMKLNQTTNSISILESITPRNRDIRVNMAIGELYLKEKMTSNAITSFMAVIKENPLALKALSNLIQLGVKPSELITAVSPITQSSSMHWLPMWIRAKSFYYSSEVAQSVIMFQQLCVKHKENQELLISLATALYYNGAYKKSITIFKKAYSFESLLSVRGIDCFAACLAKENQMNELENLANQLISRSEVEEDSYEPWVALAYFCFLSNKKDSKASNFARKACLLNFENSIEPLIIKGKITAESKSNTEAINIFLEAYNLAPYRFETVLNLVEIYLAENSKQQAQSMATLALKNLGQNPRTITLYASVLLADEKSSNKKNAKGLLEKVVNKLDPGYLPAVFLLVPIYTEEKNTDKAIEVLTKAIEHESHTKLHRLLGDCYSEKSEHEKALNHHNIAARLEVSYKSSTDPSQRLEHSSTRSSEQIETDDVPESENEVDESETDVGWSDADF